MKKVENNKLKKVKLVKKLDEHKSGKVIETSETYANWLIKNKIAADIDKKPKDNKK